MLRNLCVGLLAVSLVVVGAKVARADDAKTIDADGFFKSWLVIAGIPLPDGVSSGDAVDKEIVQEEAKLAPKAGDKVKVGEVEYTWKTLTCAEHYLDFNKFLGDIKENAVAYAVVTFTADAEVKDAVLKIGSDDGMKAYLNGKEIGKQTDDRALEKDQNSFEKLTLAKGKNTLVLKVTNSGQDFSACARFVDAEGKPIRGLTVEAAK